MLTATSPQLAPTPSVESERFYALDAVRAFALILGIFFHGVFSFADTVPPSVWPIKDSSVGFSMSLFIYVAHIFRMQTFFLIAGFFAHLLYQRRGPTGFLMNRAKRILLPFLIFLPFMYLANVTFYAWGWRNMGVYANTPYGELSVWQMVLNKQTWLGWFKLGFPLMHLWFLYYLSWFCGLGWLVSKLPISNLMATLDKGVAFIMTHWWGSLLLGTLLILPMQTTQDVALGGIRTPFFHLIPQVDAFLNYGFFFNLGWLLHRNDNLMNQFRRFQWVNLGLSILFCAWVTSLFLIGFYTKKPITSHEVYIGLYAMASMTAVFAFIGIVLKFFNHPSKRIRYLSDSAYWLYLAHLPLVVLLQILVAPLQIHWLLKLPLIFVPSFTILFLTYHYGVRNTWLGVLLNGRRYPLK